MCSSKSSGRGGCLVRAGHGRHSPRRVRTGHAGARRTGGTDRGHARPVTAPERAPRTSPPALPAALGGRRPAARRPHRAHPADPARRRASCWSSSTTGSRTESKYFRFFAPMPELSERDVAAVHQRRPPRPGRVRADRRRADHRRRPLRRSIRAPARPRSPSSSRTPTRAAASASCCSSTSPRPAASAASTRFVAEVLPDNRRMIQTFRDAGYQVDERLRGRRDARWSSRSTRPTPSIGVMRAREHRAESASIERVLQRRSRSRSSAPAGARTPSARRWCATSCSATTPAGSTS